MNALLAFYGLEVIRQHQGIVGGNESSLSIFLGCMTWLSLATALFALQNTQKKQVQ